MAQTLDWMLTEMKGTPGTIALVGDGEKAELEQLAKQFTKEMPEGMQVVAAGNILTGTEATKTVYAADGAIIVVKEDITTRKTYQQIRNHLEVCGVINLGIILTDCQAIK